MYQQQLETEQRLNRRNIHQWITDDLATLDPALVRKLERYIKRSLTKQHLDLDVTEVTTALLEVTLTIPDSHKKLTNGRILTATGVQPIQAIATRIGSRFFNNPIDAVCFGIELLESCEKADIYEMFMGKDEHNHDTCIVKPLIELEDATKWNIKQTQYLPPMLCQPRDWTDTDNVTTATREHHYDVLNNQ